MFMSNLHLPPILQTKLHRPQYDPDVVPRPGLLARLEEGLRCPLILVSAPAGFGKSTLLSTWLEQSPRRSTWLSLDAGDSDLDIFVRYLIAAVRVLYPGACAETEALAGLSTPAAVTILAYQLINDLDGLDASFVLVLDDYERIEHSAVHEFMSILIQRPPRSLRLVITTRRDPPLPLAKLRARGQMTEVRMTDLRLRPEEVVMFWQGKQLHTLDAASIAKLDSVVEGWPAGLRLAAISARLSPSPRQAIAALASSSVHATDYLFREIFAAIPASRQQALLRIALLDRFCDPLCDVLCRVPDSAGQVVDSKGLMAWLQDTNLFLVPLDAEGLWFRFHHLFLQLLRQQGTKLLDAQTVAALYTAAADWYAEAGMLDDALALAFLIPSQERAVAIIARQRVAVLNQEDWPRMRRWLELFPPTYFAQTPILWMIKANVLLYQFRLAEVDSLLDQLEAHPAFAAESAVVRCQVCFWRGDPARGLEFAKTALATLSQEHVHSRGNALIMLALCLQCQGEQEAGFARLLHELSSTGPQHAVTTTRVVLALCGMHWAAGNFEYATHFSQRLIDRGEQNHLPASRAWGHYFLGCVHYWRNELADAEREFAAILEQPLGAHSMVFLHSHFGLALSYLAQGRGEDAQDVVDAVFAWAADAGHLGALKQVEVFVAHFALLQGNTTAAFGWAAQCGDMTARMPMYFLEWPTLTLLRVCIAQGGTEQLARATTVLEEARNFVERTHNALRMIDVLTHEALLHEAYSRPQAALGVLRQALALAEPLRLVRPFVDLGPTMAALLHTAAKQEGSAAYAAQLLAAFPHGGQQAVARSMVTATRPEALALEPLTDREIEVLSFLAQRLSNKEIAEILVVAPVTIKSHTRNLFAKLQVNGRREAVERARALGLLY
jgi:LuxR family maltose regulon positive regulatory protein